MEAEKPAMGVPAWAVLVRTVFQTLASNISIHTYEFDSYPYVSDPQSMSSPLYLFPEHQVCIVN